MERGVHISRHQTLHNGCWKLLAGSVCVLVCLLLQRMTMGNSIVDRQQCYDIVCSDYIVLQLGENVGLLDLGIGAESRHVCSVFCLRCVAHVAQHHHHQDQVEIGLVFLYKMGNFFFEAVVVVVTHNKLAFLSFWLLNSKCSLKYYQLYHYLLFFLFTNAS